MSVCKDIFIVQIQLSNYVTFIVLLKWTVRLQVQIWKQMFVAKHFFFFLSYNHFCGGFHICLESLSLGSLSKHLQLSLNLLAEVKYPYI